MNWLPVSCSRRALHTVILTASLSGMGVAGVVSVTLTTRLGTDASNAIVVFDPLNGNVPAGHATAVIDQIDKRFVPRISVVRTGTAVNFPNSDHIRHQVYSFSQAKPFTLKLYAGSPKVDVLFDKPGLVVLGCNIHDSMSAFLAVVDSPYFAKSGPKGDAAVTLPPGRYRLRVWHPKLAAPVAAQEITVTAADQALPLTLDIDTASDAVAAWPD